jgi:hypothetical protein
MRESVLPSERIDPGRHVSAVVAETGTGSDHPNNANLFLVVSPRLHHFVQLSIFHLSSLF